MRKAGSVKAFSAFFMCPVSHTFPAYNGNEMPSWYTIIFFVYGRVVYKPRCLPLFFLCGLLRQFARGRGMISPQCPGTPRVKPSGKSRLFSTGGQSFFMVSVSQRKLFFSCGVLRGCAGVEGAFPCGGIPHHGTGKKSGFPGLCQPVAHAWEPMPNPVIFRPKLSGFPRVAATTRGFSPVRTYQEFPARLHELMFVQENRERAVTLLWGSAPLFILF